MPTPKDIHARRFYRAAQQRLKEGQLLLEKLDFPTASVYLTGYAVECALKALLLNQTSASQRDVTLRLFHGASAHDFEWLRGRLAATGMTLPGELSYDWRFVSSWSTDLRYEPREGERKEAQQFLRSARKLLDWIDRSI